MDEINWRYLIYVAIAGPVCLFFVKRMSAKVPEELRQRLSELGIYPISTSDQTKAARLLSASGGRFQGTYKGWPAGYNQGAAAVLHQRLYTKAGTVKTGCEFWVGEGLAGPLLVVVERTDKSTRRLALTLPSTEVQTGDHVFDQRFRTLCDDPAFAHRALTQDVRSWIGRAPIPFLCVAEGRVFFPITRVPEDRNVMMSHPEFFLDTAGMLAQEVHAAIQERAAREPRYAASA